MSSPAWIVFRKELRDTLRDRRTLMAMIVFPLLLGPVLMTGVLRFSKSRADEVSEKVLKIAVADPGGDSGLAEFLRMEEKPEKVMEETKEGETKEGETKEEKKPKEKQYEVLEVQDVISLPEQVESEDLTAAIIVPDGFQREVAGNRQGTLTLIHKSSDDFAIPKKRLEASLARYESDVLGRRFAGLGLDPKVADPIAIEEKDVASKREVFGRVLGGILPYMFILFCFTGGMYPAIDLAAGEKERGTLETLLSSPASRLQVALGKFAVVTLTGIASALLAMLGTLVSVQQGGMKALPPDVLQAVDALLAPGTLALMVALLVPLSVFFAAALLMLSLYARSYKEAMSVISPMMIVVIVPAMIALLPGVRLGLVTAAIPILNVSLATREVIAGTAEPLHLAVTFLTLVALAGAGLVACARWFSREDIVFRS